jgi:hypothetical protein
MFHFRVDPSIGTPAPIIPPGAPVFTFVVRSRSQVEVRAGNSAASTLLEGRSNHSLEIDSPEYARFAGMLRTHQGWIRDENGNTFPGETFADEVDDLLSDRF